MVLLLFAFIITPLSCNKSDSAESLQQEPQFVKGVYGNPGTLLDAGYRFDDLGLNAIFVRSISLNQSLYETAQLQNVQVFVEFPTLLGRNYVEEHPEAWPIDETGEKSPPADWFMGVCPTDPGFWEYRRTQLREILELYDVDGIFLDYVHWHAQFETPDPILPETCFCDRCMALFAEDTGLPVQGDDIPGKAAWILENADSEWRNWRSTVLNRWITGLKEIVREMRPEALLGIFYCSWFPDEYDGALYKTLGIDIEAFIEMADVLSPMLFHKMKDRPAAWVGDYTSWLGDQMNLSPENRPLIWPIVQAHDNPGVVTPDEFRQVMTEGSRPPSTGIMMFSDRALLDNPEKIDVMMKFYHEMIYN
ncbi:MAG: hypothetical protein EA359_16820 [Balneolaceae bacterium]|nr:MAG: hypothetical protein EA359_16820 [Balneolaceae bacterium]